MKRRVLVLEPDATGRALVDRALTTAGYAPEGHASSREVESLLDDDAFELCLVDELAGGGAALDEVQRLRARYPRLPVVVMGTMLSSSVLLELMRLGVRDALPKPFTPSELRGAVGRAIALAAPSRDASLDHAAAVRTARESLATGRLDVAGRALARAWSIAPMDAEVMALEALRAELDGRDRDADRGYRATLALGYDEDGEGPDPHEGLARLAMYGAARPVTALDARWHAAPARLVAEPRTATVRDDRLTVMALSIASAGDHVFLRAGHDRAFALLACDLRPERALAALARVSAGRVVTDDDASLEAAHPEAYPAPDEERGAP